MLVVAAGTDSDTAEALAADLRRHADPEDEGSVTVEVTQPLREASAAELLQQLRGKRPAPVATG